MIGLILGDIIGSPYEHENYLGTDIPLFSYKSRFTDDTVLACAIAQSLCSELDYKVSLQRLCSRYPNAGYGGRFIHWFSQPDARPYHSWGNGSAVRAVPIGFALDARQDIIDQATLSAICTHNHPEGIAGAQAAALTVYWLRTGQNIEFVKRELVREFRYSFDSTLEQRRAQDVFSVHCRDTVESAILAVEQATSVEHAIRLAISIGGDSDTIAALAGAFAQAAGLQLPQDLMNEAIHRLTRDLQDIYFNFCEKVETPSAALRSGN